MEIYLSKRKIRFIFSSCPLSRRKRFAFVIGNSRSELDQISMDNGKERNEEDEDRFFLQHR